MPNKILLFSIAISTILFSGCFQKETQVHSAEFTHTGKDANITVTSNGNIEVTLNGDGTASCTVTSSGLIAGRLPNTDGEMIIVNGDNKAQSEGCKGTYDEENQHFSLAGSMRTIFTVLDEGGEKHIKRSDDTFTLDGYVQEEGIYGKMASNDGIAVSFGKKMETWTQEIEIIVPESE